MPLGASSSASERVKPITAALLIEYAISHEAPVCPHIDETLTIAPSWFLSISLIASLEQRKYDLALTLIILSYSSAVVSLICLIRLIPALFTRMSIFPTVLNRFNISSSFSKLHLIFVTPSKSGSVWLYVTKTSYPFCAKSIAVDLPIPVAPPVIKTFFKLTLLSFFFDYIIIKRLFQIKL